MERHIHADRRLAFQVLTAFGVTQEGGDSSTVLKDEGVRKLVEFHTGIAVGGKPKTYRTVEWVTLNEPDEIRFDAVEAPPLALLRDRFILRDVGGCTHFRYESTIGLAGGLVGWFKARAYARRVLEGFMHQHTRQLAETIEERARRSRLYPHRPCGLGE